MTTRTAWESWNQLMAKGLAILAMAGVTFEAVACAVCFGESDSPFVKGTELSVLFMVIVTYFLIGGGAATVFILRRRQQRQLKQDSDSA